MDKRERKGLLIFVILSLTVIAIGGIMHLYHQTAVGFRGGYNSRGQLSRGTPRWSGSKVMMVGLCMMLVPLFFYVLDLLANLTWRKKGR